jgi:ankyrin repeat protein
VNHAYDVGRLLKLPTPQTEINLSKRRELGYDTADMFVEMAVDNWLQQNTYTCDVSGALIKGARYRRTPRDEYEEEDYDLSEAEYDKLGPEEQARYVRFAPPPPKDCASLARVIKKEIAYQRSVASKESCVSYGDEKPLKKLLERIEPTAGGHEAMLVFLESREWEPPRLSVVVCAGAVWALRWLIDSQLISLRARIYPRKGFGTQAQACGHLQRELSLELRKHAPWLASAVSQHAREGAPLTLGIVLAALAVSRGALALLEMLVAEGVDVAALRLAGDRTLLHVVVRHAPKHAVVWLVEHGPAEWLTKRTAAGTSPLHEAILAGHVPVVYYLLEQGGAAGDEPTDPKCVPWDELGVRSEHEAIRNIAEEHRAKIACSVLLPQILRAPEGSVADVEARLDALLKQHASAIGDRLGPFRGSEALYTRLIRTALDGGRAPAFMRWLYVTSGLFRHSGITGRILHRDDYRDKSRDTHLKLWRELAREHGGPEGAAPEVTAALDELLAAEEHAKAVSTQLYDLDKKLVHLWEVGAAVPEIESVQHQINQLLVTAPPSEKHKDMRVAVYGMNMSKAAGNCRGDHGLVFPVKLAACDAYASGGSCNGNGNGHGVVETADDDKGRKPFMLGHFDLLAACALNGHLHLVHYLLAARGAGVEECWLDRLPMDVLKQIQGPSLGEGPTSRVASALVTTLEWNGPLAAVQALCAYLEQHGVDLNAIQRLRDPGAEHGSDSEVGVLDNALLGILHERSLHGDRVRHCGFGATLTTVEHARLDCAFASVSWLATHTKAKLRPGAFADLLDHYILRGEMGHTSSSLCAFRGPAPDEPEEVRLRHLAESQALVLRLTRLCVEELGATWSDKSAVHSNRSRAGDTALQRLTNGGWMKAVGWLGRERGAPLQGLILDPLHRTMPGDVVAQQQHAEALRQLQEEQARSWARAEGAL